jgi:hypothetical protein
MKPICSFSGCKWVFSFPDSLQCHTTLIEASLGKETLSMKKIFLVLVCFVITCTAFAEETRFSVPVGDSPAIGPANAPVTIIEFLDFQ